MVREAQVGSNLLFRVLIEHSPDVIVLITPDGTITYVSPSITHIIGYTCEVVGMDSFTLLHPDDHENLREQLTNLTGHAEKVHCLEHRWRCKDGTWRCPDYPYGHASGGAATGRDRDASARRTPGHVAHGDAEV